MAKEPQRPPPSSAKPPPPPAPAGPSSPRMCETCDHYRPHQSGNGGECHRFPPTMHPVRYPNGEFCWETHNPIVYAEYRCGEWTVQRAAPADVNAIPVVLLSREMRARLQRGDWPTQEEWEAEMGHVRQHGEGDR